MKLLEDTVEPPTNILGDLRLEEKDQLAKTYHRQYEVFVHN